MKKIIFIFLAGLIVFSCARKYKKDAESDGGNENRVEITPLIINSVILRDTNKLKNIYAAADSGNMVMGAYESWFNVTAKFLNNYQFNQLKSGIKMLVQDPGSQVYLDWNAKPLTKQEVRDRVIMCDSIKESSFDAKGNEVVKTSWMCDSTSRYGSINRILFYESMYYNKNNNMIEKDLLGYSVQRYVEDRNAYKTLFMVFKDEKAVEKVKKNYIN